MTFSSQAAALRGTDYHHAFAWYRVCKALDEPDVESISVEDRHGGAFDDIVVRRTVAPDEYYQLKTSLHGNTAVDWAWLSTSKSTSGHSPLQHFYRTFLRLSEEGTSFTLTFMSTRSFDHKDPVLSCTFSDAEPLDVEKLFAAGPGSAKGKSRAVWAEHLGIDEPELKVFLEKVIWQRSGGYDWWQNAAVPYMKLANLRSDRDALIVGANIVGTWVTDGRGPRQISEIRDEIKTRNLDTTDETLNLVIQAIDRPGLEVIPTEKIDFLERYIGDSPGTRFHLREPVADQKIMMGELQNTARSLEKCGSRKLHISGAMRLPLYFIVGTIFSEVRPWTLSTRTKEGIWATDRSSPRNIVAKICSDEHLSQGQDLAVGIALTYDITTEITRYVKTANLPVGRMVIMGPPDGIMSRDAVPTAEWLMSWVRNAKDQLFQLRENASRTHLFMAAPAVAALFLGHQWNMMPPTVVYEYDRKDYFPFMQVS